MRVTVVAWPDGASTLGDPLRDRRRTSLLSVMHANNEIATIGHRGDRRICRDAGVTFQATPYSRRLEGRVQNPPSTWSRSNAPSSTAKGRRRALRSPPTLSRRCRPAAAMRRAGAGTSNVAGIVGLGSLCGSRASGAQESPRMQLARRLLAAVAPASRTPSDRRTDGGLPTTRRSAPRPDGESLIVALTSRGFACRALSACTSCRDGAAQCCCLGIDRRVSGKGCCA